MEFTDTVALTGQPRMTRDGYMVVDARTARTGIQLYRGRELGRPEMDIVRVWRPAEEVFARDALASFAFRPVTNDHPRHMVTAKTWRDVAVGITGDTMTRDGDFVRLPFTLMDGAMIDDVRGGKSQLSWGYTAEIDWSDGTSPEGEQYDAVQRNMRGNHLAVVDAARAGPTCRIGDSFSSPPPTTPTTTRDHRDMPDNLRTVLVDGITISVTDQGAQAIEKLQRQISDMTTAAGRRDAEVQSMRDTHSAALTSATQAKDGEIAGLRATHTSAIEAKDGEIAGLRATHDAAIAAKDGEIAALKASRPTADQMDAMITARSALIDSAKKILGATYDAKGKTDAQIRRSAVEKRLGAAAVADKSDEYITAAFDTLTAVGTPARDPVREVLARPPQSTASTAHNDHQTADDAHDSYVSHLRDAWRTPASRETA